MNQLTVSNTVFQHKPSHLITWYSSDGVTKAQIDYELIRQRWRSSVLDSRSIKGADSGSKSGSDHRLIITKILLRLAVRRKNKTKPRVDSSKLKDETVKYALSLELINRFDVLDWNSLSLEDK